MRTGAAPIIGRESELELVLRLVGEAADGRGGAVVVRGEAGIGKTRFLSEALGRARGAGAVTLSGRATEGSGPYRALGDALLAHQRREGLPAPDVVGPFAGVLGCLVPGWASPDSAAVVADLPLLVSEGLLRLLALLGSGRGVLLAVDDVQWVDPETLQVLDRLVAAVAEAPVVVLLASRPDAPELVQRLAVAHGVRSLQLDRLGPDQARALASASVEESLSPHVLEHVVEHAEGLPFLVEELLRGLAESGALSGGELRGGAALRGHVPASFSTLVRQRLAALSEPARAVVEALSVIGRAVDWRLLPPVTGRPPEVVLDGLREAVDRGVLEHERDVFRFPHALTRDAVLASLLPQQRQAVAAAAAGAAGQQQMDPLAAASLHELSGDADTAARLLVAAARAGGAALLTREQLLRRALALAPDRDDAVVALVDVLTLAGRGADARELGDPLLARLPASHPARGELARALTRACLMSADVEDAAGYVAQAGTGPATAALAAHVAFAQQRLQDAEALARTAVEQAHEEPEARCEALEMLGRLARHRDRIAAAEQEFLRVLEIAEDARLPLWRVRALHELGTLDLLTSADPSRLELARRSAIDLGSLWTAAVLDLQITACHALRLDLDSMLETARRTVDIAESLRLPALAGAGLVFVALAEGHRYRPERLNAVLDDAESRLAGDVGQQAAARFVRGTPAMLDHDVVRWRGHLREGMRVLRADAAAPPSPYRGLFALVETVLEDGSSERDELRESGATAQACNRGALAYAEAIAAGRAGRDPRPWMAAGDAALAPLVWRRHHALLLVAPCAFRDGWGEPVQWLREAIGHFEASGDTGLVRACRDELRRAGVAVPRRGRGDSVVPPELRRLGVTSREHDVLQLLAAGMTNSEIAERLVLSARTVETHVSNLLAKTGSEGRRQLAKYVEPQD